MQILNISVMNRNAKYLTTTPYPVMLGERMSMGFGFCGDIVRRDIMKDYYISEQIYASSIEFYKPIVLRSILRDYTTKPESIQVADFGFHNPIVRRDVLKTLTVPTEAITAVGFTFMNPIVRKRVLYDYTPEPEMITASFGFTGAIVRTN